jgi:reactive intermediate/imine deaminase
MLQISTKDFLKPSGHYSQAIIHNDTIYVSAQLPIDPLTGEKKYGSIDEETERILKNIDIILNEAGSDKDYIIKTTVYLSDMSLWDRVNKTFSHFFQNHKPARTVVSVKEIHFGFKIAIEAIAGNDF